MIASRKTIRKPLKNMKGFTIIEVMIVMLIISILSSVSFFNYIPLQKKVLDATALSDVRNLAESIVSATLNDEDVDYTKINTGGAVGDLDTGGNSRFPVFVLSPGVEALITGDSSQPPDGATTIVSAIVYHTRGTDDPATLSGKKEYTCDVNESSGIVVVQ